MYGIICCEETCPITGQDENKVAIEGASVSRVAYAIWRLGICLGW